MRSVIEEQLTAKFTPKDPKAGTTTAEISKQETKKPDDIKITKASLPENETYAASEQKVKEKNCFGVILGKALYENKISIQEAKKII